MAAKKRRGQSKLRQTWLFRLRKESENKNEGRIIKLATKMNSTGSMVYSRRTKPHLNLEDNVAEFLLSLTELLEGGLDVRVDDYAGRRHFRIF